MARQIPSTREMPRHPWVARYPEEDGGPDPDQGGTCGYSIPGSKALCFSPLADIIHTQNRHIPEVLQYAQYLVDELQTPLMLGQMLEPGGEPKPLWYLNHEQIELATIHVDDGGNITTMDFTWMSNAPSVHGFDVVPFMARTIHWLLEGRNAN